MEFGPGILDAEALVDADLKSISSRFKGVNVPTSLSQKSGLSTIIGVYSDILHVFWCLTLYSLNTNL